MCTYFLLILQPLNIDYVLGTILIIKDTVVKETNRNPSTSLHFSMGEGQ